MNIRDTSKQISAVLDKDFSLYFSFYLLAFPLLLLYETPAETFEGTHSFILIAIGLVLGFLRYCAFAILIIGCASVVSGEKKSAVSRVFNIRTIYIGFWLWLSIAVIYGPPNIISKFFLTLEYSASPLLLPYAIWNTIVTSVIYICTVYLVFRISPIMLSLAIGEKVSFYKALQITKDKEAAIIWGFASSAKTYAILWVVYNFLKEPLFIYVLSSENATANFVVAEILKLPLNTFLTPLIFSIFFISLMLHFKEYHQKES